VARNRRPRKYTVAVTVKLPDKVATEIRRRAGEDDRSPAAWIRRLLIDATRLDKPTGLYVEADR
jgi:hypothetical protein